MAKLQRGMKEGEVRRKKNSPELVRRRWSDGELADVDPISPSNVWERSRTGSIKGEEVERW
jgi:hypothetical protein